VACQQHEIETVLDLVDTVLDGDAGHGRNAPAMELVKSGRYLAIPPAKCKVKFTPSPVAIHFRSIDTSRPGFVAATRGYPLRRLLGSWCENAELGYARVPVSSAFFAQDETWIPRGSPEGLHRLRKLGCVPSMARRYISLGLAACLC
jgi:hypothetical protein